MSRIELHEGEEMNRNRRRAMQSIVGVTALAAIPLPSAWAQVRAFEVRETPIRTEHDLLIAETPINVTGRTARAITINGTMPGPLLHFREGDDVTIRVTNRLEEMTAIHWHGLLVPNDQDGVPGFVFPGIGAGETFTYRFKLRQAGTYWYHSHAALQEAAGYFAPLIIEPSNPEPFAYDRDFVVVLSDWIDTPPPQVLANLKKIDGYYNYRRITTPEFLGALRRAPDQKTRDAIWKERMEWAKMRMDPTDFSDGGPEWTFLMAGKKPQENWTALFKPGERVRLRFINASPMNLFDVRIPGVQMTVVQADGQNVRPIAVDEFRIGNGETYDVIVHPKEAKAYTIFAPTIARIGYARGTLAPELGMSAPVPAMGQRPVRTMADMGMAGMDMGDSGAKADDGMAGMDKPPSPKPDAMDGMPGMPGMESAPSSHEGMRMDKPAADPHAGMRMDAPKPSSGMAGMDMGGASGAAAPLDSDGIRRLKYDMLRALEPNADRRPPQKEIVARLTGDMTRYFWSINGKKLSQAEPFEIKLGERVRFKLTNETMMEHPMHLHGVFMELVNGNGEYAPRKHTIIVPPAQTVELDATYEDPGVWAFHCHLFYHAATGMFRLVKVT